MNGTDRDHSSNVDYLGDVDGESIAMKEYGISANDQVTYASDPSSSTYRNPGWFLKADCAVLVYDKRKLMAIAPSTNEYCSNGFHAFLTPPSSALHAIIITNPS